MTVAFEWDPDKAKRNAIKHEVTFEEARSVFFDDFARTLSDPDHSISEQRFLILGISHLHRLLVVCHCDRNHGSVIRIISARKATSREARNYLG